MRRLLALPLLLVLAACGTGRSVSVLNRPDLFDTSHPQAIENAVGTQLSGGWRVQ